MHVYKHLINKEIESSLKGGFDNDSVAILSDKMKLYLGLKCILEENYCLLLILRCVAVKGTKTFVHNYLKSKYLVLMFYVGPVKCCNLERTHSTRLRSYDRQLSTMV